MKLSAATLAVLLAAHANQSAVAFRVGNEGNNDLMRKSVEDLLTGTETIKPPQETGGDDAPPLRNQLLGTETPCLFEYWSRPDIHTLGNRGFGGALHAAMAPIATKIIDMKAYGGVDVRKNISHELRTLVNKTNARVVDLCCGVGMSTRALETAFHDAEFLVGVDTSDEMISMANTISVYDQTIQLGMSRFLSALKQNLKVGLGSIVDALAVIDNEHYPEHRESAAAQAVYRLGNAENTKLPKKAFDLVTIMYGFHEVPQEGRARIINEARRLLRRGGHLAVLDICPTYEPSPHMLAGEPFVEEYQKNIDSQLANFPGFKFAKRRVIVPGHVNLWLLRATA